MSYAIVTTVVATAWRRIPPARGSYHRNYAYSGTALGSKAVNALPKSARIYRVRMTVSKQHNILSANLCQTHSTASGICHYPKSSVKACHWIKEDFARTTRILPTAL
jgi:hypothetical protein